MYRFLLFLKNIHTVLLFIVLEIVAGWFFFRSNSYQKAKFINASNVVMSSIYDNTSAVVDYFGLFGENERLANENARLKHELSRYRTIDSIDIDTTLSSKYIAARVIRNTITKPNNFITLNKGRKQGIKPEMALINEQGIVGYVLDCSDNFSVAISILNNKDFRTSGKIKNSDFQGSVMWDGKSYRTVQLDELPKYTEINIGDTIVTTEYSAIFPAECPIGVITDFEMANGTFYRANIELFVDMSRLQYVYAIELPMQAERTTIEQSIK